MNTLTKREAIESMVTRDFSAIPTEWVKAVAEQKGEEIYAWPMWGTMWLVDRCLGETLLENSHLMVGDAEEIDLDSIEDDKERENVKTAIENLKKESISWGECAILDNYVDEEMAGAYNIKGTAAYIYEIDGQYVMGIQGAGWSFYDGVWDRIYKILGLEWHKTD